MKSAFMEDDLFKPGIWVIYQAWSQDGWTLTKVFFCMFMDRDKVKVHKHAKKE